MSQMPLVLNGIESSPIEKDMILDLVFKRFLAFEGHK